MTHLENNIRNIDNIDNSQFICLGKYTNESPEVVRKNIINELTSYKDEYVEFLNENEIFDEYINKMSQINTPGDNITLIAASQFYNLNICLNDEIFILIKADETIDLYLNKKDNYYFINNTNTDNISNVADVNMDNLKIITIFDDPINYNVKHPLNTDWLLWISTNTKSNNWLDSIKNIITVETIEDFWGMFNNIPNASDLNFPFDYYFFKKGILPMWEDERNKNGGKMTITFKKQCNINYLNNSWLNTVLGCISEQFENHICGIVLNIRKHQDRINIWLDTDNEEQIKILGLQWKTILELPKMNILYVKHDNNNIQFNV